MGIFEDEREPLFWIGWIERHIDSACFQNGQQTDDHIDGVLKAHCDWRLRLNSQQPQMIRELISSMIQFLVTKLLIVEYYCYRRRRPFHLRFKQLRDTRVSRMA